jgi:hypothetical protein
MRRIGLALVIALCAPAAARAQRPTAPRAPQAVEVEVDEDRSPAADLYVKRRPAAPESPRLPSFLEARLTATERRADGKREEAIGLLRQFLAENPTGPGQAEGLFKLAELLWEDARRRYATQMDAFERATEACRRRAAPARGAKSAPPCRPPRRRSSTAPS